MGNINSDLQNPGDASLLLLLVRYWSGILDAADNLSTISKSRKLLRTPSLTSIGTQDSKVSRKLKRSRPVTTIRRTEIIEEDFDWQKTTKDELQALKGSVPWKEFEGLEWGKVKSPKMRRRFRKRRKKTNNVSNEMWTLSERSYKGDDESTCGTTSEKMFWKTTKLSPDFASGNNMLWRAFKDLDVQSQSGSSFFGGCDLLNITETSEVKMIGNIETKGRKTRLSRWNFLRQPGLNVSRETSFRIRKPTVRRTVASSGLIRRSSVRSSRRGRHLSVPGKGWVLFKNRKTSWESRSRDIEEEPEDGGDEDCSCCSCDGCAEREKR